MKYLSYGVMIYMLMALIWWTVLLSQNNEKLYHKNLTIKNINIGQIEKLSPNEKVIFQDILAEYTKKKYMILGEGLVFGISLIIGMWLIQKAYNKELENNLKQKNFLLSVTHELKTPITSIGLLTETLVKRKVEDQQRITLLNSINSENKRLESLVSNLLIAARLDNNYSFNFEDISLETILQPIVQRVSITHPDAVVEISNPTDLPNIECDKEAMISVFTNLIENSIKYSESPAMIKIIIISSANHFDIKVSDQGSGIPDKEKTKVFDQFYRIGNEDTRKTKGTGLGLFIVKKIIDGHKGSIHIADNIPNGTVFTIILPHKQNL